MFRKAIEAVYNSMVKAELPMQLHIQYLIQRLDPSLELPKRNYAAVIPGSIDIEHHAEQIALQKQFHSSLHNNSCVNKHLPYCRYI
jgi:hypothetical protein